ncbi:beta strand repeat-containing protein [Nocardioides sp. J54]|uniref:beta strand repeat-containing protein n=1 Tax=Nocardioides sp. J54 TaxID=935866 RepID=UPI0004B4BDEC|nr:Ig-like domain-containing protein [Nocardioides sp. J54]
MRRLIAALAAVALTIGLPVLLVSPAQADITAPAAGTIKGTVTFKASGATDSSSLCINGSSAQTVMTLRNSTGGQVWTQTKSGAGAMDVTYDTHNVPNGSYTLEVSERDKKGTILCSNTTRNSTRSYTVQNVTQLDYTGVQTGAINTSVQVSATLVDPNKSPEGVAGKSVVFTLDEGNPDSSSITVTTNANGVASGSLAVNGDPRTAQLKAAFAGDTHFVGSSKTVTFEITKNPSTTTLLQPAQVVHSQPVSFTALVARGSGNGAPTGTVQFTVDGADLGSPVPVSGGQATSPSTSTLNAGNHTIGAVYSGDTTLAGSSAETKQLVVAKAPTATVLTSSGSPTVSGQTVTFTAKVDVVAPGAGTPTGGVQFDIDGDPYGTAVNLVGDTATLEVSDLLPGNHDVQATYNGTGNFASSTSATVTHGVELADTSVTLASSNPDAVAGEPLTFSAQVSVVAPGAGQPTGTVQFAADGEPIGAPVAVSNGVAVSPATGLDAGDHVITANYSGDNRFAGGSAMIDQEVESARTTTAVTTSPNPSVVGQPVTVTATVSPVSPATGTPEGAIRFTIDGAVVGIVDLVDGEAEIEVGTLERGNHEVKAQYLSGDANFRPSTSTTATHVVNKAATKTVVTSSSPVSAFGQPVTFTADVSVLAPGAGSPTGTVTFTDGDDVLGTADISSATGGVVSVTVDDLSIGQHAVVATYDGDDSFTGSTGSVSQKVQRAQTATTLTSSVNPSQSGQGIRFTATVAPVAPGAGEPSGTVQFTVNGANLGSPVALVDGAATSNLFSSLSPGTYRIAATYSGDPRFVGSSSVLDQGNGQEVTKGATSMELVADTPVADHGVTVTFTVTVAGVAPANGKPTGVVQLWNGGTLLGAASLAPTSEPRTSTATFATAGLAPGSHEVRAVYVGNFNFEGTEATTVQAVGVAETVVGVASDANPSVYGDTVTLTATVANAQPGVAAPTGNVVFRSGDDVVGQAQVVTEDGTSTATLEVEGLTAGSHDITATYSGDVAHAGDTSPVLVQVVERAQPTLVAHDIADPVVDNYSRVEATLTGLGGEPLAGQALVFTTGPVLNGGVTSVCAAVTNADGYAKCDVPLRWGALIMQGFQVAFAGNDSYAPAVAEAPYYDPND